MRDKDIQSIKTSVLTVNGGSSSIKFALYEIEGSLVRIFYGKMERTGKDNIELSYTNAVSNQENTVSIQGEDNSDDARILIDWLKKQEWFVSIKAIGHRIVHGMKHTEPTQITPELLSELRKISDYDPEHLPGAIRLIEEFSTSCPALAQVACFDTAFHGSMPSVAKLLPIPRRYYEMGVQRYGFHGLSYAFLLEELENIAGSEAAGGKIVFAHLGNGASVAAVKQGKSIDTSMGFTPVSGLPMGTRTGDLDTGVGWYLMQFEKLTPEQFSHLINNESGLLGVSETSSDMRELINIQHTDSRAAEAIELFCYQTKKWIGSFTAALGGLDSLVFSGGIGENAPEIRSLICGGLAFLGVELDEERNVKNDTIISAPGSKVPVYVIKTNEELVIARLVCQVLNFSIKN